MAEIQLFLLIYLSINQFDFILYIFAIPMVFGESEREREWERKKTCNDRTNQRMAANFRLQWTKMKTMTLASNRAVRLNKFWICEYFHFYVKDDTRTMLRKEREIDGGKARKAIQRCIHFSQHFFGFYLLVTSGPIRFQARTLAIVRAYLW